MASRASSYSLTWANVEEIIAEANSQGFGQQRFDCFVETGTLLGQTVISVAHHFQEVHTIEITPGGFAAAQLRAWRAKGPIHFHQGDSVKVLPWLLPNLLGPTFLFLDAHFSGGLLQAEAIDYMTGGAFAKVPLLEELCAVDQLLPHAALIVIDDMDLFGNMHSFDELPTDWRNIDVNTIHACLRPERIACAFALKGQNRYVIGMHPGIRADCENDTSEPISLPITPTHHVSTPGNTSLDTGALRLLRSYGEGWDQIANLVCFEYYQHSFNCREEVGPYSKDSARTALAPASVKKPLRKKAQEVLLTREDAKAMQTELMRAFAQKGFQHKLHVAWVAAGGDKVKQIKARQEVCLPIQTPILSKYGFEPSMRGVMESVGIVRKLFLDDVDMMDQATMMRWLVDPSQQWRLEGINLDLY